MCADGDVKHYPLNHPLTLCPSLLILGSKGQVRVTVRVGANLHLWSIFWILFNWPIFHSSLQVRPESLASPFLHLSERVRFNVLINTLYVISETGLSSQSLALVLTT